MIGGYAVHGHALVSADDRIADSDGVTPATLRHDSDRRRFQAALDLAVVTVLGRRSHAANPNTRGRNRLVLSASARAVERRDDAWWWNPADISLADALAVAAPATGIVAVPGGRPVFDYFLSVGFDAFHLARMPTVALPGGIPVFTAVSPGRGAADVLADHGLTPGPREILDRFAPVELTVWRRA